MELNDLRKEIDAIDDELIKLFCKRMAVAGRIADVKRDKNLPILDAAREEAKLQDVMAKSGPEMAEYVREVYKTLFSVSRSHQENRR